MMDNVCLSGGAEGADLLWGASAAEAGHSVFHFIFPGHRSRAPAHEIAVLTAQLLAEADEHVLLANRTLQRRFPTSNPFTDNLLRRNWFQVRDAGSVYAVASIKNGRVQGGTAWAVQMFIDRGGSAAFVFDQERDLWCGWSGTDWLPTTPPRPAGIYAGIGSRTISERGKTAIRDIFV